MIVNHQIGSFHVSLEVIDRTCKGRCLPVQLDRHFITVILFDNAIRTSSSVNMGIISLRSFETLMFTSNGNRVVSICFIYKLIVLFTPYTCCVLNSERTTSGPITTVEGRDRKGVFTALFTRTPVETYTCIPKIVLTIIANMVFIGQLWSICPHQIPIPLYV